MNKHVLAAIDFVWPRMDSLLHFFYSLRIHNRNLICSSECSIQSLFVKDIETLEPFCIRSNQFETMVLVHILFHCCYSELDMYESMCVCVVFVCANCRLYNKQSG